MKYLALAISVSLLLGACGNKTSGKVSQKSPTTGKTATKKLEPGESLLFNCPDSFHQSKVEVLTTWSDAKSKWLVMVAESDSAGKLIRETTGMTGQPHATESLHIMIYNGASEIARLWQTGFDQAIYSDGGRTLNCTFR